MSSLIWNAQCLRRVKPAVITIVPNAVFLIGDKKSFFEAGLSLSILVNTGAWDNNKLKTKGLGVPLGYRLQNLEVDLL